MIQSKHLLALLPFSVLRHQASALVVQERDLYNEAYEMTLLENDNDSNNEDATGSTLEPNATAVLELPCVQTVPMRLQTAVSIGQVALMGQVSLQLEPLMDFMKDLVINATNFTLQVPGVNTYQGLYKVAEFNTLSTLTNNFFTILKRDIVDIQCHTDSNDTLIVTYREKALYNYIQDTLYREAFQKLTFAPNCNKLLFYEAKFSPILINALTDNLSGQMNAKDMCNEAALRCEGDLFPFDTLQECYDTLTTVPATCSSICHDCTEANTAFLGDTLQCRHYHMLHTKVRPELHCQHLKNITTECQPQQCSALTHRLSPQETHQQTASYVPFDASLSNWMRILQGIIATLALLLPMVTFTIYRRDRKATFQTDPENIVTSHTTSTSQMDENNKQQESQRTTPTKQPTTNLPSQLPSMNIAFRLLRNNVDPQDDNHVVVHTDAIAIGGTKLTAVNGPSGCGKSTLMKLLCGFPQPHMTLELQGKEQPTTNVPVAYTPQSSELWPKCMKVRDILGFACLLQGCNMSEYMDCVAVLQLQLLLDQTFNTLSGGQQQRVHFLANMIRSQPSILFMDEPLSALDEENAIAALQLLKQLPVAHSFVITVHRISPALRKHFDCILEIDLDHKRMVKHHISEESRISSRQRIPSTIQQQQQPKRSSGNSQKGGDADDQESVRFEERPLASSQKSLEPRQQSQPFWQCTKSMLYLWHSLFWGWPALDVGLVLIGAVTAAILGFMGDDVMESGEAWGFVPNSVSTRLPVYMLQFIANAAALSAFVVALVLSNEDRLLLQHFCIQGDLGLWAVAFFNFLRFAFYGIVLATILMIIPLAIMNLVADGVDTMIMNVAFFAASYQYLCYVLSLAVAPVYGPHLLLVTFLPMTMFTGLFFPWSTLSPFFKLFHYINPVFYCMTACSHLLLASFDPNCPPHAYPYLTCASPAAIAEITELQDFGSTASQVVSAIVLLLSVGGFALLFRQRPSSRKLNQMTPLARHESFANTVLSGRSRRRGSSLSMSASTWLEARRMSMSLKDDLESSFSPMVHPMVDGLDGVMETAEEREESSLREQKLHDEIARLRLELAAHKVLVSEKHEASSESDNKEATHLQQTNGKHGVGLISTEEYEV